MELGKNFEVFLIDGDVTGRIKCTLENWTGVVYKIPRKQLKKCKDRQDLKRSGVYFLFGKNNDGEDEVYIGQARVRKNGEGVLFRVEEHVKRGSDFTDAVMITTQNNSFGPTEISYLENRFTNLAIKADRYKVRNGNDPNPGHVTEGKKSGLEYFIEYAKMFLGVLGYKVFVSLEDEKTETEPVAPKEEIFYLEVKPTKSKISIHAEGKRTNEGFVVLKGSMIKEVDSVSLRNSIKELRDKCKANGEIKDGKLTKNRLFNSPSYAAKFVLGTNINGRIYWKTKEGITLKDLEEKELQE